MAEAAAQIEYELEWSDDSSDDSWHPTSSDDEYSDDEDLDWSGWTETPVKVKAINVKFDTIDEALTDQYLEEKRQIKARLEREVASIRAHHNDFNDTQNDVNGALTSNEIMNCFFSPVIAYELHGAMNKGLHLKGHHPMDHNEFEIIIRLIFYFSYYNKGPTEMCSHPENFPEAANLIALLHGNTEVQRNDRLLALLRSMEGDGGVNRRDESITWTSVYNIDDSLENLFYLIGRQASKLCFVQGRTSFIIDDDKLRLRSLLAATLDLVRSKGLNSFGPVANCVNSLATGINLSSYMSHHGESALSITEANLMCILGVQSTSLLHFPDTGLGGDRAYNDEELTQCLSKYLLNLLNTVKRGPGLAYKFGKTSYPENREQRVIPEGGPSLSLGATRTVNRRTLFFTAWRSGTGRVTFLQSTKAAHSASEIQYESASRDLLYSKSFEFAERNGGIESLCVPMNYKEHVLDIHGVREECKAQGTPDWFFLHRFRASSTLTYYSLPKTRMGLPEEYVDLLENGLGLQLSPAPPTDFPPDLTHAQKSLEQLKRLTKIQLVDICKSYHRPYSGGKEELARRIKKGPLEVITPTDLEMMLKHTFFAPLKDKDKTPHKIGILNEAKVRNAIGEILKKFDGAVLDAVWECGLISRKDHIFLATSLDAWVVYYTDASKEEKNHLALEIKTPTSNEIREKVLSLRDEYGDYTYCEMGDEVFSSLVYMPQYRVQVVHHAAVCGLDKVLFVVADEYKPVYATMISFSPTQKRTYISLVTDLVYKKSLQWAYTALFETGDPEQHIPEFREEAVSTPSCSVDRDTLLFHFAVWQALLNRVHRAGMPLPTAKRIAPAVVCAWNKSKGRIDEMSEYLKSVMWHLPQATPKQRLTIREIKKTCLNSFLASKHCYNSVPPRQLVGRSFSQIRRALSKHEGSFLEFMLQLGRSFELILPVPGMVPRSPAKRPRPVSRGDQEERLGTVTVSLWQRDARAYCQSVKRNKLERFRTDPLLNRIRLDRTLNHVGVLVSGRQIRCTLCSSGRDGKHTSGYRCPTCCVYLCTRCHNTHGNATACYSRWHNIRLARNLGP